MIVYKVTSPSGKCYIGITSKSLIKRKQIHLNNVKYGIMNKFYKAVKKYGQNLIWEILDTSAQSWEELCKLEQNYIQKFNSYKLGYNSTLGGEGTLGYKPSEERINKLKAALKIKHPMTGKHHSEKSKELMRNKKLNWKFSETHLENMKKARPNKKFEVLSKSTLEKVAEFNYTKDCAETLKLDISSIRKCLKGTKKTCKGYILKYVEEACHSKI